MNRRGSALLIVLGFLSFMVVSAVAFSIYMRSARVPSSVFRKNASIRQLVKAGLARAISELDNAVRNDPYPGVTFDTSLKANSGWVDGESSASFVDYWLGRVFMPPNPDEERRGRMAPESETVAVASFEGLGYVPPPLINDVRFLSRRTWTAKWRDFDYAVGRYAYCAVNVSDYFDINRMSIDEPRTGLNRVSLAPLFTDGKIGEKISDSDAKDFADFVKSLRGGSENEFPFVSMLDYALAKRNDKKGFDSNPFYTWIVNSSTKVYEHDDQDDAQYQTFVTDSWFPLSYKDKAKPTLDLSATGDERGQPFDVRTYDYMTREFANIWELFNGAHRDFPPQAKGENGTYFKEMMSITETVALYDYLDQDDQPLSLALPTVERVPMVVAISPGGNCNFKIPQTTLQKADKDNPSKETDINLTGILSEFGNRGLRVTLAYPFNRGKFASVDLDKASYTVKAVAKLFFVAKTEQVRLRNDVEGAENPLLDGNDTKFYRPNRTTMRQTTSSVSEDGCITFVGNVSVKASDFNRELAKDFLVQFDRSVPDAIPVAKYISKYEPKMVGGVDVGGEVKGSWSVRFAPWSHNAHARHGDYAADEREHLPGDGTDAHKFVPVLMVWVRVEDSEGYVVDCVPATFYEDSLFNRKVIPNFSPQYVCGHKEPLLRFTSSSADGFEYKKIEDSVTPEGLLSEYQLDMPWKQGTLWAVDPRYNQAPEDWCCSATALSATQWEEKAFDLSRDAEDGGTPYFFVSNQGFLQSMGELAFLPRVKERFCNSASSDGNIGLWGKLWMTRRGGSDANNPYIQIPAKEEFDETPGDDVRVIAWKCYEPWAWDDDDKGDNLFGCGIAESKGGGYVNPYAGVDGLKVALANTPVNWWAAAGYTNIVTDGKQNAEDTKGKRQGNFEKLSASIKFAFNEEGSARNENRQLTYRELEALAKKMNDGFREGFAQGKTWEKVYDNWPWARENSLLSQLDGQDAFDDQLESVDRRFLHSFWRGCFSNRQQLFLVFVRAESTALGGSGEGQIPPQQGGRAVALVWRDPETPNGGNDTAQMGSGYRPHQTRVLFYHQFD